MVLELKIRMGCFERLELCAGFMKLKSLLEVLILKNEVLSLKVVVSEWRSLRNCSGLEDGSATAI